MHSQSTSTNHFRSLTTAVHVPVTTGTWGPILALYYDCQREALPGEIEFYQKVVAGAKEVLEIGSGTGFLTAALMQTKISHLTLVEPELENLKLLQERLNSIKILNSKVPNTSIVSTKFESSTYPQQDVILLPYDTLPMWNTFEERDRLFSHAARHLKAGGILIVHLGTDAWIASDLSSLQNGQDVVIPSSKGDIIARRNVQRHSSELIFKFISLNLSLENLTERYITAASIVSESELNALAQNNNLVLSERIYDFNLRNSGISPLDIVYIFKKSSNEKNGKIR